MRGSCSCFSFKKFAVSRTLLFTILQHLTTRSSSLTLSSCLSFFINLYLSLSSTFSKESAKIKSGFEPAYCLCCPCSVVEGVFTSVLGELRGWGTATSELIEKRGGGPSRHSELRVIYYDDFFQFFFFSLAFFILSKASDTGKK